MNIRLDLLAWAVAAAMAAIPATALAAVDSFIWFEGQQGNSTDSQHKDWFEIKDFSLHAESQATTNNATRGVGGERVNVREFTIRRVADSASPTFFRQAMSSRRHFSTVKIEMRKAGGNPVQVAIYTFNNVSISKIDLAGSGDRGPEESITFVYGDMTVRYTNQTPSGQSAPPAPAPVRRP